MVMHLDRPFDLPAGTTPAGIITQVFGNDNPRYEPFIYRYPNGSLSFHNDGTGVGGHFHAGIDYGLVTGTPLKAPATGVVVFAGWDTTGFGNRVDLRHGPIFTLYGHLQRITCRPGQALAPQQLFGAVDSTGNSTGPHLHWAVYTLVDGYKHYLNPAPFVLSSPANNIHPSSFTVAPQDDGHPVRVFASPATESSVLRLAPPGLTLDCDAWTFGEPRTDHTTGQQDARWYRLAGGGWVASARVLGDAPGTAPLP